MKERITNCQLKQIYCDFGSGATKAKQAKKNVNWLLNTQWKCDANQLLNGMR